MTSQIQGRPAGGDAEAIDPEPVRPGPVNGYEVLSKVSALPVSTWRYQWEPAGVRHLGPMAQDWHGAFELGQGETSPMTSPMVDAHGVLLVAIQALHRQLGELRTEIDQLHQQLARRCGVDRRSG